MWYGTCRGVPAAGKQTEFLISNAPDEAVAKTVVTVTAPDKS